MELEGAAQDKSAALMAVHSRSLCSGPRPPTQDLLQLLGLMKGQMSMRRIKAQLPLATGEERIDDATKKTGSERSGSRSGARSPFF